MRKQMVLKVTCLHVNVAWVGRWFVRVRKRTQWCVQSIIWKYLIRVVLYRGGLECIVSIIWWFAGSIWTGCQSITVTSVENIDGWMHEYTSGSNNIRPLSTSNAWRNVLKYLMVTPVEEKLWSYDVSFLFLWLKMESDWVTNACEQILDFRRCAWKQMLQIFWSMFNEA